MVPDALAGSLQAASRSYGIGCTPLLPAVSTHARFLVTECACKSRCYRGADADCSCIRGVGEETEGVQ